MKTENAHVIHGVPFPSGQIVVTRRIAEEQNSLVAVTGETFVTKTGRRMTMQ